MSAQLVKSSNEAKTWQTAAVIGASALYAFIIVKNAWIHEDAWIYFRQVEQLHAGNGLRWNPHERAQLFTTTLGFFLLAFARLFSSELFVCYALIALPFNVLTLVLLARTLESRMQWCAAVLLLCTSSAFMDYTWSGLYNCVGHTLLMGFLAVWKWGSPPDVKRLYGLAALAGLAPLFRHDFALLLWPPMLYAFYVARSAPPRGSLAVAAGLFMLPLALWTLFALVYFGFPFPLPAYTKLGGEIPRAVHLDSGLHNYLYLWRFDKMTLLVIAMALIWLLARGKTPDRALASGLALSLFYIFWSGGDYNAGRFFTYSYLLGVVVVTANWKDIATLGGRWRPAGQQGHPLVLALLALDLMLVLPNTPPKTPIPYTDEKQLVGIRDERGVYHRSSNIETFVEYFMKEEVEFAIYPFHHWADLGRILAKSEVSVIHVCWIGMTGAKSRLDQRLIDVYGLTDVLQARLPGISYRRPGHIYRRLPAGYLESVATGEALIEDPDLNEYYKKIQLVAQSEELFTIERLKAIVYLNLNKPPADKLMLLDPKINVWPLACEAGRDTESLHLEQNIESLDWDDFNMSDFTKPHEY